MSKKPASKKFNSKAEPKGRITNGIKVRLYNWSPLEHDCATCNRRLGKNTMVVWLKTAYYCSWGCSDKAKDE